MTQSNNIISEEYISDETLSREIQATSQGWDIPNFLVNVTIFGLYFNITRIHDFSGLTFLGTLRVPLLFTLLVAFASSRFFSIPWPKQYKIFGAILIFEAFRGFLGFLVIDDLVLNDAWQFYSWRDFLLHLIGFMLAISFGFASSLRIKKLVNFLLISGLLLALWAISHAGKGPGGYLGDENDNCLMLVTLLPICFILRGMGSSTIKVLFGFIVGFLIILAIASTNSRGGFLGLIAVIVFQFLYSTNKIKWILGAVFLTVCSFPLIPEQYYKEIESIGSEAGTKKGTMQERFDTWTSIYRMWKDPRNILFGVGLENSKWNLGHYETADRGVTVKSLSGRATHSVYFQLLGDMGIWGILSVGTIFGGSVLNLRKIIKATKARKNQIQFLFSSDKVKNGSKLKLQNLTLLYQEINFLEVVSRGILCSWLGALTAAVGISILYYPTLWFLTAVSIALVIYNEKLISLLNKFETIDAD